MKFRIPIAASFAIILTVMTAASSHGQGVVPPPIDPNAYHAVYWVIGDDILSSYSGYNAVLVRGMDDGSTPTVTFDQTMNSNSGGWVLKNGLFYVSAPIASFTVITPSLPSITGLSSSGGDGYVKMDVLDWLVGVNSVNLAGTSWPTENSNVIVISNDDPPTTSYPFYMFLYDGTGNVNDVPDDGSMIGMWLEEMYEMKDTIQHGVLDNGKDALVIRFSGLPTLPVPEPTSAALFALGAACFALRRRARR